jgi:nitrate/TMAO reductase-like tetraheme cytochrome c subunit
MARDRRWYRRLGTPGLIVVAMIAVAVGVAASAGLWHASSSPALCNSCHIMRPYVEAWKASPHHDVTCVRCHYPPGLRDTLWVKYQALTQVVKWATHTYSSKPFAEVEDGSCLRSGCHDRQKLRGEIVSKRGIVFDHAPHLDQAPRGHHLRCASCHSQVVVNTHIQVRQSTCFLCHFKGTKNGRELTPITGCTGCHQPPKGDLRIGSLTFNHDEIVRRGVACQQCHLNVVEGDGEVTRERCLTCHNQPEKFDRFADTPAIHDVHVTGKNLECSRCHTEIRHALPPRMAVAPAAAPIPESTERVRP